MAKAKYEAGSIQNQLDGYKGTIKKQALRLQHQQKALDFLEDKILKLKKHTKNQSKLVRAFQAADPKLYYKLIQECFEDVNKENIPEEYRLD